MKKFFLFLFPLFIGVGLFIWVIKTVGWQEIAMVFSYFSGWKGLIILGLTFSAALFSIWKWKLILKSQGFNISSLELGRIYLGGYVITFLSPILIFGGEIFRSYILKEKHSVPWSKGMSSVIIDRILETTLYLLTIFAGLVYFFIKISLPPKNMGIILGGILFFLTVGIATFYFKSFKRESIIKIFFKKLDRNSNGQNSLIDIERNIFNFFKIRKKTMWQGFSLSLLRVIANLTRVWLLIMFLGKGAGVLSTLSILGFSYLAVMIPIPAALGSHEAVQSFVFTALGLGASTGAAFVLVIRGAELFLVLIGAVFFFKFGVQIFESVLLKKIRALINRPPKSSL